MKFEKEDIIKFIELTTGEKVIELKEIKKDIAVYRTESSKRKFIKDNMHSLSIKALSMLSLKYKVFIKINNGNCIFKIDKFKMETPLKKWVNTIMFITVLKLGNKNV